jgi:hypothetical protein
MYGKDYRQRVCNAGEQWRLVVRRIVVMLLMIFIYRLRQKIVAVGLVLPQKSVLYALITKGHFIANSVFKKEILSTLITIMLRGTDT